MGFLGDIGGDIGAIAGAFSGGGADSDAQDFYRRLIQQEKGINPTIAAQTVPGTSLGTAGLGNAAAQDDALRELQKQYSAGGLDTSSRAGLAAATTATNNAAQARTNAVQEHARAIGGGRGGVGLALQQQAAQAGDQNANAQGLGAAALADQNRRAATTAAGQIAGQARGQDYQAASAQDAVNQFNASMRQAAAGQTFANQQAQLGQEGSFYGGVYNAGKDNEARIARLYQGLGNIVGSAGDAIAGMPPSVGKSNPAAGYYSGDDILGMAG